MIIPVKVKDLIKSLEKFDLEADVYLDKDGWMENECDKYKQTKDPLDLIEWRGLFWGYKDTVVICN